MNTDIRLSVGFFDNPKTMKLKRRLGPEAVLSLQALWIWAALNQPDGNLSGRDEEDVEIAARWTGTSGEFYRTLVDLGWLDCDEDDKDIRLHGWLEHNVWAAGGGGRSDKGRFSRMGVTHKALYAFFFEQDVIGISKAAYAEVVDTYGKSLSHLNQVSKEDFSILQVSFETCFNSIKGGLMFSKETLSKHSSDLEGDLKQTFNHSLSDLGGALSGPSTPAPAPTPSVNIEIPPPPPSQGGGRATLAPKPNQPQADSSLEQPAQPGKKSQASPRTGGEYSPEFETVWGAYPETGRKGKRRAFLAWGKAKKRGMPDVKEMLKRIEHKARTPRWQKEDGQFVPHMATWLNGDGWEDPDCVPYSEINDPKYQDPASKVDDFFDDYDPRTGEKPAQAE